MIDLTHTNHKNMIAFLSYMSKLFAKLSSGSSSVQNQILRHLPDKINFELRPEFDGENQVVIFAFSPEHDGLITEASNFEDTLNNCCDAVLTYFDVPQECARLVEYTIVAEEDEQQSCLVEESDGSRKKVTLNKKMLCA